MVELLSAFRVDAEDFLFVFRHVCLLFFRFVNEPSAVPQPFKLGGGIHQGRVHVSQVIPLAVASYTAMPPHLRILRCTGGCVVGTDNEEAEAVAVPPERAAATRNSGWACGWGIEAKPIGGIAADVSLRNG